jgi:hypothetical protein
MAIQGESSHVAFFRVGQKRVIDRFGVDRF